VQLEVRICPRKRFIFEDAEGILITFSTDCLHESYRGSPACMQITVYWNVSRNGTSSTRTATGCSAYVHMCVWLSVPGTSVFNKKKNYRYIMILPCILVRRQSHVHIQM